MTEESTGGGIGRRLFGLLPERLRAGFELPARRRRRLLGALLGLVVLAALVVLPGYAASQPGFLERYANLGDDYESWAKSTHSEIACQSCHVKPGRLPQSAHRLRMLGEFYASIVMPYRQPDLFGTPGNEACERCHRDIRQASPSGDLKIPHRAHVEVLELRCVDCHSYVVHETNPEGTHSPRMVTCLGCHDGRRARGDCAACHQWKDAPANHRTKRWLIEHPQRRDEIDCEECHAWTPDWCRECHTRRPASHAGKWRTNHRFAVERRRNCETCHRADFCIRCHGEVPQLAFDPKVEFVE